MSQLDLIAHLCSRLCHDLVGPVSAVGNGVELMEEEDDADMQKQALELLAHSADLAARRLKFYRLAFGAAGGEGVPIQLTEARATCQDFVSGTRTTLIWPDDSVAHGDKLPKTAVKLLLNLVLVIFESLPRGGEIHVSVNPSGDGVDLRVAVSGVETRIGEAAEHALLSHTEPKELDPKSAPAFLAALLTQGLGSRLELQRDADALSIGAHIANVA